MLAYTYRLTEGLDYLKEGPDTKHLKIEPRC